jgi:hypothetical protein
MIIVPLEYSLFMYQHIIHAILMKGWSEAVAIAISIFFTFGVFSFYKIDVISFCFTYS